MLNDQRRLGQGGRFEVVSRLGAGGMGTVFQVLDRERGTRLALKTVGAVDGDMLLRFKREFRALQDLNHPNIIGYGELFENEGEWFYTMDLIEGVNFLQYVRNTPYVGAPTRPDEDAPSSRGGDAPRDEGRAADACNDGAANDPPTASMAPLVMSSEAARGDEEGTVAPASRARTRGGVANFDEARLRAALAQLAAGLTAIHTAHKVHRDIKPSNILVTPEGRAVLLDFGLVTDVHDGQQVTDVGAYGTYPYMSPEQAAGLPLDPRSDMYSVGVVLFQSMTGELPFPGKGVSALMAKIHVDAPDPSRLVDGLPPDLVQLCNQLLARDPVLRPTAQEVLSRAGAPGMGEPISSTSHTTGAHASTFVGRRAELAQLDAALARAEEGEPVTLVIEGQSGVGKSELLDQFERELRRRRPEVAVLRGRCFAREAVPYKSFDAIMDGLSGFLARMPIDEQRRMVPRHDELLARAFPVLKRVELFTDPRQAREQVRDPQEQRGRVFTAVRTLFTRLASTTPLVVFMEDLQWLDDDSRSLLGELLREPQPPALLFVGTVRTVRAAANAPQSGSDPNLLGGLPFESVPLHPLSDDDALELARALLGGDESATPRALAIVRESHGHPLFIDELARHTGASAPEGHGALQLEDAIRARVAALGEDAEALLHVLAVAGGPITLDVLARAAQRDNQRVMRAASVCRIQRLVRMSGVRHDDTVELYHDRITRALRQRLAGDEITRGHERIARTLEVDRDPDPMTLATHWAGAGEREKAARYAVRAAERANEALAFDRAAALFKWSLELHPGTGEGLEGRREKLAHALANAGRGADAGRSYLAAVEGAPEALAIDLRRRAAEQFLLSGHVRRGIESFKPLLAMLGIPYHPSPLRTVWSIILIRMRLLFRRGRFTERDESMVPPNERLRVDTAHSVAVGLAATDTIHGFDYYGRALLLALQLGEPGRVAVEFAMEAAQLVTPNGKRKRRAHKILQRARELAERAGHPEARGAVHYSEGMGGYMTGEWTNALEGFGRAERLYRSECAQAPAELRTIQASIVHCLWEQGDWRELQSRTARVLKESEERGDLFTEATIRAGLNMQVQCMLDRAEMGYAGAKHVVDNWSGETFDVQRYMFWVHSAFARSYLGQAEQALEQFRASLPRAHRSLLFHVQLMRAGAYQAHALLALRAAVEAPPDARPALLREARREAKKLLREDAGWANAGGALVRGCASAIEGDAADASWWLDEAVRRYEALGMAGRTAAARWARGVLRGGEVGVAEALAARDYFAAQGVVDPRRFATTLAPSLLLGDV
ncbi:MAG: AAA family ATPase [Polyangiales bacterium]|nr:AAA family ATPase [Myxococcales bacterium]